MPVPQALDAIVMRCPYCGMDQPVPDLVERQRALAQNRQAAESARAAQQMTKQIQKTTGNIMTLVFVFTGLILLVTFVVVGIIMWSTMR